MNNKKAFQMSLNMIIMVVLALVFLGIAIALIVSWVPDDIVVPSSCDIYPPAPESPVCVPGEIEVKRNSQLTLDTAFYNDEDADISSSTLPEIACAESPNGDVLDFQASSIGKDLPVGEFKDYKIVVSIPKDAPRGTYPCMVSLSETQEDFILNII